MEQVEQEFPCPFCGEIITMLLDVSVPSQAYTEDCEVCCRPILIQYSAKGGEVVAFSAQAQ